MRKVAKSFPKLYWDFDKEPLNTFGLRSECPVFGYVDAEMQSYVVYICFTPGDLDKGEIYFDTGKKCEVPAGSIADWNNFGNERKIVTNAGQIVKFVKSQLKNK